MSAGLKRGLESRHFPATLQEGLVASSPSDDQLIPESKIDFCSRTKEGHVSGVFCSGTAWDRGSGNVAAIEVAVQNAPGVLCTDRSLWWHPAQLDSGVQPAVTFTIFIALTPDQLQQRNLRAWSRSTDDSGNIENCVSSTVV